MSISQMLRFAELTRAGDHTVPDRIAILEAHDRRVEQEIAGLREKQAAIQHKIDYYRSVVVG